ncbi:MAG: DUF3592 domain-containing protein [Gammaproteobacteria bacterium]|nr:DUF3592 domain-containing protein [Gammaproteobacteria bacterium]
MFNPYLIILILFTLAGFLAMAWGWNIIAKARKTSQWPTVEGVIERSELASDADDLLPGIEFSYTVNGQNHRRTFEFARDITPSPELAKSYVEKYAAGTRVAVYYDPAHPERATLEPGLGRGDWMVFALGLGAAVSGILFIVFG